MACDKSHTHKCYIFEYMLDTELNEGDPKFSHDMSCEMLCSMSHKSMKSHMNPHKAL